MDSSHITYNNTVEANVINALNRVTAMVMVVTATPAGATTVVDTVEVATPEIE